MAASTSDTPRMVWRRRVDRAIRRVWRGERIKVAFFQMSGQCPFTCSYCYQSCGPEAEKVPVGIASTIIQALAADGWYVVPMIPEIWEPTLPYLPLLTHCRKADAETTGTPLKDHPEWLDALAAAGVRELRVTVLADPDLHRRWTGRERSDAIAAIRTFLDRGFRVVWNYLLTRHTFPVLEGQLEEAAGLGVHGFNINYFFAMGRGSTHRSAMLDESDRIRSVALFERLRLTWRRRGVQITRFGFQGPSLNPRALSARLADRNSFCFAGEGPHGRMMFIDADRSVYGCPSHRDPRLRLGHIGTDGTIHLEHPHALDGIDRSDCSAIAFIRNQPV